MDYEKYFYGNGVTVVEWADKIQEVLPEEYVEVVLEHKEEDQRLIVIRGVGARYEKIADNIDWREGTGNRRQGTGDREQRRT